jgi:hypothetical protein
VSHSKFAGFAFENIESVINLTVLERVVLSICTMYPALLQQLGEQDKWVAHLIQNQFKIDQVEALLSVGHVTPVQAMMTSFAEGGQKLAQHAADKRFK